VQLAKVQAAFKGIQSLKGLTAVGLGIAAIGTALALSLGPAIAFEAAFANVAKTVDGTDAQLDDVRDGIISLSNDMPAAATEIAGVAAAAGQLGVGVNDVLEFTEVMVQLGTATNLTAEQAAISLARFQNILQIPIRDTPKLAAALVELGNNSAATESEILTLGLRLAGAGKQIGLTGEEVLGIAAAMKSLGIEAESGGSSMSRILQDIIRAVENGGPKLKLFADTAGLTTDAFKDMIANGDASVVLVKFFEGLQGIEAQGGSVLGVLEALDLDSIRLLRTISALVGGGDQLAVSLGLIADEAQFGGALLDEYGRFAETTSARLEVLKNRVVNLGIALGTPALGAVVAIVDGIGDALLRLIEIFGPVGREAQELIGNLVTGFGDLFSLLGGDGSLNIFVDGLAGVAAVLTGLLTAVNALPGPVLAVAAAILLLSQTSTGALIVAALGDALFVLKAKAAGATVTLNGTAISMTGLAVATASVLAPLAILSVAVLAIGKSFNDAKKGAAELEGSLTKTRNAAKDNGNYAQFVAGLEATRRAMQEAADSGGAYTSTIGRVGNSLKGFVQDVLPGVENTVHNSTEAFNALADSEQHAADNLLNFNIQDLAKQFNTTEDAIFAAASELGVLNDLVTFGTKEYATAALQVGELVFSLDDLSEASGRSLENIIETGVTLNDFALALDTSAQNVAFFATQAGTSLDELTDTERFSETRNELERVQAKYEALATIIGTTVEALRDEVQAVDGVIAANDRLVASMDRVNAARDAATFVQRNLNEATAEYEGAVESFKAGEIGLEGLAEAQRKLTAAIAATGAPIDEVKAKQDALTATLFELGAASGKSSEEVAAVAAQLAVLSEFEITQLQLEGLESFAQAEELAKNLRLELQEPIVAQIAAETGETEEAVRRALALGESWAVSVFRAIVGADFSPVDFGFNLAFAEGAAWDAFAPVAELRADPEPAIVQISRALTAGQEWDNFEPVAQILADPSVALAAFLEAEERGVKWDNRTDESDINSDNTQSDSEFESSEARGSEWDGRTDESDIDSDKGPSDSKFTDSEARGSKWDSRTDTSTLDADKGPADSKINDINRAGSALDARTWKPTVRIAGNAIGTVDRIQERINALRGRTISVRVRVPSNVIAEGAILYASGGIGGVASPFAGAKLTKPGPARIYAPTAPGRFFAEPVTGGEAYIPLAPQKRPRSIKIWQETGRRLGVFAEGGIAGQQNQAQTLLRGGNLVSITAPIQVDIDGSDLNADQLEAAIQGGVRRGFDEAGRDLANLMS